MIMVACYSEQTEKLAWPMKKLFCLFLLLPLSTVFAQGIDNPFVRITRTGTTCTLGTAPGCTDRIIVALSATEILTSGTQRTLARGELAVFGLGDNYAVKGSDFIEVVIKPDHPASSAPGEMIAAEKNALLFDADDFFVFEEKLNPGDTRARHSHSQRVVIQLNRTTLKQWPDNKPELIMEILPDAIGFSAPVIHVVENIGALPLRGIIIEFKPGRVGRARR